MALAMGVLVQYFAASSGSKSTMLQLPSVVIGMSVLNVASMRYPKRMRYIYLSGELLQGPDM